MECLLIQAAELMNNAVETVMCTAEQVMCKAEVLFRAAVPVPQCMSRPGRNSNRNRELGCVEVPGMSDTYYLSLSPAACAADAAEEDTPVWHSLQQGWHSLDTAFLDAHLRTLEAQGEDTTERRMWLERDRLADYATALEESATSTSLAAPSVPLMTMPLLNDMDQAVTPVMPKSSPVVPGAPLVPVCPEESVRPLKRTCLLTRFAQAAQAESAQAESLLGKRRRRASDVSAAEGERKIRAKRPTKMPARYNDFL